MVGHLTANHIVVGVDVEPVVVVKRFDIRAEHAVYAERDGNVEVEQAVHLADFILEPDVLHRERFELPFL